MSRSFIIPIKCVPWNQVATKSYWVYSKIGNDMKLATLYALKASKLPVVSHYPVTMHYHIKWKQKRRHDLDSLFLKHANDQIVASGILIDDSLEYVSKVIYTGETGADRDEIIVTIE